MIYLFFPILSFCAGFTLGCYELRKKTIPSFKFVKEDEKNSIIRNYGININEDTRCVVCSEKITTDNLGIIAPSVDHSIFVCSKQQCMVTQNIFSPSFSKV